MSAFSMAVFEKQQAGPSRDLSEWEQEELVEHIDPDWKDHFREIEDAFEFYHQYGRDCLFKAAGELEIRWS